MVNKVSNMNYDKMGQTKAKNFMNHKYATL